MLRRITGTFALIGAVLAVPPAVRAQSPAEILDTAMERYRDQVAGIDNYRLTQTAMGFETTSTLEKTTIDGFPVFRPVSSSDEEMEFESPYAMLPQLIERGTLEGTEEVDGRRAWNLLFDVEGIDFVPVDPGEAGEEVRIRTLRLWIDEDDYLVRKMHMEGDVVEDGETRPVDITAILTDYRQVDGMWHPFRTEMTARGLVGGTGGMSEEEAAETRAQLEEMKEQLESMPTAQREQIEKMMGPQMEQLEKMLASGEFTVTITVRSLETNVDTSS